MEDRVPMLSVLAICVGASVGALARWALSLWLNGPGLLPWGTVVANLAGGYLVGVAVASLQLMPQLDPAWRLLLITGFLGGLTTFSSFSAEVVGLLMSGRIGVALLTASLHLCGSLLLTWLGLCSVRWVAAA